METLPDVTALLAEAHGRIAPRFARAEMRARSRRYLTALLSRVERKNGWRVAEAMGDATPHGVQELLNSAVWDADLVRDDLRAYVLEHLADPTGVLIIDETSFIKKGSCSAGVRNQYCGRLGRLENCQVGVFVAYAGPAGAAFIDRDLYLPKDWAGDPERRGQAGVPEAVAFATKPQLAQQQLGRAFAAGVAPAWVLGDAIYGSDGKLRRWLEEQRQPYVLGVTSQEAIWGEWPEGTFQKRADAIAQSLPADAWRTITVAPGAKGPRTYDWAWVPTPNWLHLEPGEEAAWETWLLLRRSLTAGAEVAYARVFAPAGTPLAAVAEAAGRRWAIEVCFEAAKQEVGLADYEVRRWEGWRRHITLALLAHAVLVVAHAAGAPTTGAAPEKGGGRRINHRRTSCR